MLKNYKRWFEHFCMQTFKDLKKGLFSDASASSLLCMWNICRMSVFLFSYIKQELYSGIYFSDMAIQKTTVLLL